MALRLKSGVLLRIELACEKPRMRQMMFLLAFPGLRGGRVAPGWQTVFTWRLEVEEK